MKELLGTLTTLLLLATSGCTDANIQTRNVITNKAVGNTSSISRHQHSTGSSDPFDWLGPVPDPVTMSVASNALDSVFARIKPLIEAEMRRNLAPQTFVCRPPAEVGPIPHHQTLQKFVSAWPDSKYDPTLMDALNTAASEGNWLAQAWMFAYLQEQSSDPIAGYRIAQMLDVLLANKAGALYTFFGNVYASAGSGGMQNGAPNDFDMYAALHHSYSAQYKVGQHLRRSDNPAESAAGERMMACVINSFPEYASLLEKEKDSLNMLTF